MIVEMLYEDRLKEYLERWKERVEEENIIHVTELISCPLKIEYLMKYPEVGKGQLLNSTFLSGIIMHKGLVQFLREHSKYTVLEEVEVQKSIGDWTIKGRVDCWLTSNSGEDLIIEIKTSRRDIGLPHQHHIEQLKLYLWITGVKNGLLVYITPDRITEYEVKSTLTDSEVQNYIDDFIKKTRVPRFPWECSYCLWSNICNRKIVGSQR